MVSKLIGKKLGMTRYFLDEGRSFPVSIIKIGPCVVTQKKTVDKDGYGAIQVGFEPKRESRVSKPLKGHFMKSGGTCYAHLREIRVDDPDGFELGQELGADLFQVGAKVHVSGYSKGRGFAGVMKRWGFSGSRDSHGAKNHRVPGSIGCNTTPGRVIKGKRLPGHYGDQRVTIKNLEVIDVRPEMGVILIKGAVPGSRNGVVEVRMV
jgi:large subunit ribosomal protein L3